MTKRAVWGLMAVVLVAALAVAAGGRAGPPTEDQQVHSIADKIRCPTCRGLSAADSDAPAATAIRDEVRRRLREGQSEGQIVGYLEGTYGADIRLEPEAEGIGVLVWALPAVGAAAVAAGLVVMFSRRRLRNRPAVSPEDRALVEEALRR
ncbi:MAG: cytochrome c-type biogenesis protein CcmH [Actinomycetota bacterium]|nr:cytochrome c-type biogenesis protein CcmH [Actinomycetota bacterium]